MGGEEGMEGKLNGNFLRLIPGLCLEDRTNFKIDRLRSTDIYKLSRENPT